MPRPVFFSIILFCVVLALLFEANRSGTYRDAVLAAADFSAVGEPAHPVPLRVVSGGRTAGCEPAALGTGADGQVAVVSGSAYAAAREARADFCGLHAGNLRWAELLSPLWCYRGIFEGQVGVCIDRRTAAANLSRHETTTCNCCCAALHLLRSAGEARGPVQTGAADGGCVVAFRTMRDAWFLCMVAAACIADVVARYGEQEKPESAVELAGVFATVAIAAAAICPRDRLHDTAASIRAISRRFPVKAVNFLRQNPVPGRCTTRWTGAAS